MTKIERYKDEIRKIDHKIEEMQRRKRVLQSDIKLEEARNMADMLKKANISSEELEALLRGREEEKEDSYEYSEA